jgi:hypothetical protein
MAAEDGIDASAAQKSESIPVLGKAHGLFICANRGWRFIFRIKA